MFARGRAKTGGRKAGTPNKGTERARRLVAEGDDKAIIDKIVADARDGDRAAQQLYLRHLRPTPPRSETYIGPVDYVKPENIAAARAMILTLSERLAKNKISVEMHDALVSDLHTYLADKAAEQQRLLEQYEAERDGLREPHRST
jgi:hypothetical protein